MLQLGMIDQNAYQQAVIEPIVTRYHGTNVGLDAPYLAEMVRKIYAGKYGEESYSKGYQVYTTLSSSQQQAAQSAVFKGLLDYDIRHGYRGAEKHLWTKGDAWNIEQITNYLSDLPSYEPFEPAIVTAVNNKEATIIVKRWA